MDADKQFVKKILVSLLSMMQEWEGDIDQLEPLLNQCNQKLMSLSKTNQGLMENEELAQAVIQEYQKLLAQLKVEKEEVVKEMARLNQPDTKRTYQQLTSSGYEFYY
ncbi:hypothetical protein [Enterococcus olivae]